jgi:surface carbohydrate biosynthesis protein
MESPTKKIAYCFLISNEARDFYLLAPIIYYLEKFENYSVSFEFIWDAHKIRKKRPDLVILPNSRGHLLYYQVAKYCVENEIMVFNHDSEGNFNSEIDYDFWAYNYDKKNLCPIQFTWNQRIKDYLITNYQLDESIVKVSGAPGFDKYAYLKPIDREKLLKKHGYGNFKKVVGYAGWAFGKLYNPEINDVLSNINKPGETGKKWLEEQRDIVENALKAVIEAYPDVLFILKKHPRENFESDYRDSRNEMNRLAHYPNVFYLKDEIEIQDLIQISDLWMAFESTSIMEAWLLNIPTLMINGDPDFVRVDLHTGSLHSKNAEEVLVAFEELYGKNNLAYFNENEVVKNRNSIFSNSIGFADGLNHLRSIKEFRPFLNSESVQLKPSINFKFFRLYILLHIGKYFFIPTIFKKLPKLKKTVWVFENYTLEKIKKQKKDVYGDLNSFYTKHHLDSKINNGSIWGELE